MLIPAVFACEPNRDPGAFFPEESDAFDSDPRAPVDSDPPPIDSDTGGVRLVDVPRFVTHNVVDVGSIEQLTVFRSSVGHDYSDARETCRSMKHYFCAQGCESGRHEPSWTTLAIHAPTSATVTAIAEEQSGFGSQITLAPTGFDGWELRIFHVDADPSIAVGLEVDGGQRLGHHASDDTLSDVAVFEFDEGGSYRLVSYFDTLRRSAFRPWRARGVRQRSTVQISASLRDANPLRCDGDRFVSTDPLPAWFALTP